MPDGVAWKESFQEAVALATTKLQSGQEAASTSRPKRALARNPSDPDQRAVRAAHSEALIRMTSRCGVQVPLQGRLLALFRFGDAIFASDARCPHQGANLCEGEIGDIEDMVLGKRYFVRCKVHKFQFDLSSGTVLEGHCLPLRTYKTRIRDRCGDAFVEVGFDALGLGYFADESGEDDF